MTLFLTFKFKLSDKVIINITGIKYNTVHAMNEKFFDEINALVQYEPTALWNEEWLGIAKDLGIEKGVEFKPDARMQRIFKEAARIATAEASGANVSTRSIRFFSRITTAMGT